MKLGYFVAVAVTLLAVALYGRERAHQGELRAMIRAREQAIAALAIKSSRLDTVYVADTVTLTRWRATYNVIRDTLRLTDTVAVKQFVVAADSTIRACSVALETCERRVEVRDSIIAAKDDLLRLERKRRPSWLGTTLNRALWFGIGVGAGAVLNK